MPLVGSARSRESAVSARVWKSSRPVWLRDLTNGRVDASARCGMHESLLVNLRVQWVFVRLLFRASLGKFGMFAGRCLCRLRQWSHEVVWSRHCNKGKAPPLDSDAVGHEIVRVEDARAS